MDKPGRALIAVSLLAAACASSDAAPSSSPAGPPVLEDPTLRSLGAYWIIRGDDNRNARVDMEYRRVGDAPWRQSLPMFRVEKGATSQKTHEPELAVPDDSWLFAGSLVMLQPDTAYEIRLSFIDPDGGRDVRLLRSRTIAEPVAPAAMPVRHVGPGAGGGRGTPTDPFKGFAEAEKHAAPGTLFLVHKGIYDAPFAVNASGAPGKPIVWRAAGDGEAVIRGAGKAIGIQASGAHDVWFEGLGVRGVAVGIAANDAFRIVIRRCQISVGMYGINFNSNPSLATAGFFVSDNIIEGPCTWPRTKGIEDPRGIQATGRGHVICHNRVRGFADAIDTFPSRICAAIDIHDNEISEMTDDGIEMDFSERNTRCFRNRLTNVFQGISVQPVYGGPAYIFRNALYNVDLETFKMHHNGSPKHEVDWAPSGALMYHNTSVRIGDPLVLWTSADVRNCRYRNNLFIGTNSRFGYDNTALMVDCDFDYDGFGGGPWEVFLKWNGEHYLTLADVKARAPVERHAVFVGAASVFASGITTPTDVKKAAEIRVNDLRLKPGTPAVDRGEVLPGFNDDYRGKAPDLGAFETGDELPAYGPRPVK